MFETCSSVVMAQHEQCFAGSVLHASCILAWIAAGQLCILCGSNLRLSLNHPQYFAALLVNRIVGASAAPPHRFPILKPLSHFTNFLWELHRQPRLPSVRKTPLGHFWRPFFGTAKTQQLWANCFEKMFLLDNQAKFGQFRIFLGLWVAEFCGNSAETGATRQFCLKNPFFGFKNRKTLGRKPYVNSSGFSAAILQKILKGQNPSLNGPDCIFQRFSARIRGRAGPFPLNSDKFACSYRLVIFWCCTPIPQPKTTQTACFGQN